MASTTTKRRSSGFWSQVRVLAGKDLTILIARHFTSTLYAALMLPVIMAIYLGIGQNLQASGNKYGDIAAGGPKPVRSLQDGLAAADSQRINVVFVNNGLSGGNIDRVIDALAEQVTAAGRTAHRAADALEMGRVCMASFQGTTPCYGAVEFHASPDEGDGKDAVWNYTLRGDSALGQKFNVEHDDNDPEVYVLPLQRAVDAAIARVENNKSTDSITTAMDSMQEWPFTDQTEKERTDEVTRNYQHTFINYMGVSVLLAFFGISYHLPGYIATERERGLSQLIDAMMVTSNKVWGPQAARITSYFASFAAVYAPGWIVGSLILKFMVWKQSSVGVVLPYFLLSGLASAAQALVGGTLFKRAQLSGVVSGLAFLLLGVLVQAVPDLGTAPAVILGLLFAPCNMVLMIKYVARYEAVGQAASLVKPPDDSDHSIPAIVLWVFLICQISVCPFIAAGLERWIHGAAADSRSIWTGPSSGPRPQDAVMVQDLTKTFRPSRLRRIFSFVSAPRPPTVAVKDLSLSIPRGEIVTLLGANGSGKSTTLDSIAGLQGFGEGKVTIDASGGVGVAPQKNVLWDELTVWEHVRLFNRLKAPPSSQQPASPEQELKDLLNAVGLATKKDAKSATLSGGQKRKLQLAMMLTGGSSVCCVDEVSSGIDPLSRRKIWDILLAERGRRTIILTTHFLDEADLLSDKIAIMSRGVLRAEGSAVELKAKLGAGFRIHLSEPRDHQQPPPVEGVETRVRSDSVVYVAPSSELAVRVIRTLDGLNISYRLSSPTIEDVFLHAAEEYASEANGSTLQRKDTIQLLDDPVDQQPLDLQSGRRIGILKQISVLLYKRVILLKHNWLPYLVAFLIPLVAAAVMQILVSGETRAACAPVNLDQLQGTERFDALLLNNASVVAGPASSVSNVSTYLGTGEQVDLPFHAVDSFSDLSPFINDNRKTVYPGGFWSGSTTSSGSSPTVIYRANAKDNTYPLSAAVAAQNLLDSALLAVRIAAGYAAFDTALGAVGKTLQLAIYFSVALAIAPAFLALYPNLERRTQVRGLQYSSGVRALAQWSSHLLFDFGILLLPATAAALIFAFTGSAFWNPGYLVPVFLLYAVAGILLGYLLSLLTGSQLATWAAVAAFNGVGLAVYLISFLFIINLSDATKAQGNVMAAHWVISAVFPLGSLMRAMFVSLNVFYQACDGAEFAGYAGEMEAYGGPILYLAVQSCLYFGVLLLSDSRVKLLGMFSTSAKNKKSRVVRDDVEKANIEDTSSCSHPGLQVQRLTKTFGSLRAVDDVSFDVRRGEVFALLGPNGAGKSTTISMIRGDVRPGDGDVLVSDSQQQHRYSVLAQRALARANMGVCPQFDALDEPLTVTEHLRHYARLRGVADISRQVEAVVRAVGLCGWEHTAAAHLSGGSRRKLSLGIALTGNPSVLLLDEPSSGLDAAAKRVMWRTLRSVSSDRSVLLTTHSMEEADALAKRAGIMARSMLAAGGVDELRTRFGGDAVYVHLVSRTAPRSSESEMEAMREGVREVFPGAVVEERTYHGQMRFSVPMAAIQTAATQGPAVQVREREEGDGRDERVDGGDGGGNAENHNERENGNSNSNSSSSSAIAHVLAMLEDNRERLGIRYHSVAPTTLNDVFLAIVGEHQVKEEGYGEGDGGRKKKNWGRILLGF